MPLVAQERVFELGERVLVLSQVAQPALVPHMAEVAGQKLPYEVSGPLNHKQWTVTSAQQCGG